MKLQDKKMRPSFPAWVARDLELLFRRNYPGAKQLGDNPTLESWRYHEWGKGFSLDRFGGAASQPAAAATANNAAAAQQPVQIGSIMALEAKVAKSVLALKKVSQQQQQKRQQGNLAASSAVEEEDYTTVVERFMLSISNAMQLSAMARCHSVKVGLDRKRKGSAAGSDQDNEDDNNNGEEGSD